MNIINRRTAVILHDVTMAALAWQLAWLARFNFTFPYFGWQTSLQVLPEILLVQTAVFWFLGLYRGLWRFASIPDLWNIIKAAVLGTLLSALVLFIQLRLQGVAVGASRLQERSRDTLALSQQGHQRIA